MLRVVGEWESPPPHPLLAPPSSPFSLIILHLGRGEVGEAS